MHIHGDVLWIDRWLLCSAKVHQAVQIMRVGVIVCAAAIGDCLPVRAATARVADARLLSCDNL